MQAAVGTETLNRGDLLIGHRGRLSQAGAHGASINQDSAGTALAFATTIFRSRKANLVAQHPQKTFAGSGLNLMFMAVNDQSNRWHISSWLLAASLGQILLFCRYALLSMTTIKTCVAPYGALVQMCLP